MYQIPRYPCLVHASQYILNVHYIWFISSQDRYAEGTFLPPIDQSQDWFLINSEEENGFTVLEFSRNFTTCDDRDRDITVRPLHTVSLSLYI